MAASYIPDGYEEKAFIEGVPGLYASLGFTYRPMRIEEASEFVDQITRLKPREAERHMAKTLASKIRAWTLRDQDGNPVPVEPKSMLSLRRRLSQRVFGIVLGSEPSDLDPSWSDEEQDAYVSARVQGMQEGKSVQQIKQEADEKNS